MTREEIEKNSICLVKGRFGKPDLHQVVVKGQTFVVKDVKSRGFFLRWTLGLWLIEKEWKIYQRLKGLEGIPQPIERIDRFAFAMEYIPGKAIGRGERLSPSFFWRLERILREVHARGVVHLDLRHKGNILVSDEGKPFLIDFNSSFSFDKGGWLGRLLFPFLQLVDYGGLLKLKERASPSFLTPEEAAFLKRFNRWRRLWIFN
ncbi:MAG: hypothetical protein N3G78_02670 [Desulfobacterota bacterium]|nr:hypothetical protein [Thermodesulfobacteriota bacterium]